MEYIDFTMGGKCSGCGECCGNILPLMRKEVPKIRDYVERNGVKPQPVRVLTCPFRDETNCCCTIYHVRPYICRIWDCAKAARGERLNLDVYKKKGFLIVNMRKMFFFN